jgi:hypothetical protein
MHDDGDDGDDDGDDDDGNGDDDDGDDDDVIFNMNTCMYITVLMIVIRQI